MRAAIDVIRAGLAGALPRFRLLPMTSVLALAWLISCGSSGSNSPACPNDYPAACPSGASAFAAEVQPLMRDHCTVCHAPGQQVPTLDTYANIRAAAPHVLMQLTHCPPLMPPAPNPALTADQRKVILGWLACGAEDN
jgi:uncharacterized membrane protein